MVHLRPMYSNSPIIHGSEPDEKLASAQQAKLEAKLDAYEVILSKYKYLGGDVRAVHNYSGTI